MGRNSTLIGLGFACFQQVDGICSQEVVGTLGNQNIFSRLMKCATDRYFLDSDQCLAQLPSGMLQTVANIPDECRVCYIGFVQAIAVSATSLNPKCDWFNQEMGCQNNSIVLSSLATFQACAGLAMTYPSCSTAEIRFRSVSLYLAKIVEAVFNGNPFQSTGVVMDSVCNQAYHQLYDALVAFSTLNQTSYSTFRTCWQATPNALGCNSLIQSYLDDFERASGYEIDRKGPECRQDQILKIENLRPYLRLTSCAFDARDKACRSLDEYFDTIQYYSDPKCAACYGEYLADLLSTRAVHDGTSMCEDIYSTNCKTWIQTSLLNVKDCSGLDIVVTPPR